MKLDKIVVFCDCNVVYVAEKVSAAGELWRKLSVDEQSKYEQEAERQYQEAKEIFDRDEPKREEVKK